MVVAVVVAVVVVVVVADGFSAYRRRKVILSLSRLKSACTFLS